MTKRLVNDCFAHWLALCFIFLYKTLMETPWAGEDPAPEVADVPARPPQWKWLALAAIVGAHLALAWLGREPGIATGQDDVEYITLAQSIRQGGYADLMRVDAPTHAQYPPGYPALLAAWSSIAGDGFDTLLVVSLVSSVTALFLLYFALDRRFGQTVALGSVAILAVNPHWNAMAGAIRSEMPYVLLTVAALVLAAHVRSTRATRAGAIAAAIAAALTRSAGITLLIALGIFWIFEKRWRAVTYLALAAALTVGPWMLWTAMAPEQRIGSSYVAEIRAIDEDTPWTLPLPQRILAHAWWYATTGVPHNLAVPTVPGTPVDNVLAVAIIGITALIGGGLLFRHWRPAALYVIAYAGLLLVWLWSTERFVIPLLPFIAPAILLGAAHIGRRRTSRTATLAAAALALLLATGGAAQSIQQARQRADCRTAPGLPPACLHGEQVHYFEALAWIDVNLPDDAVLLTAKNGALFWYTHRKVVSYNGALAQDSVSFLPWNRGQGAGWILLSNLDVAESTRLARLVTSSCHDLDLTARFSNHTMLFRIPDSPGGTSGDACEAMRSYPGSR